MKLLLLHGAPAAGKLTVAKALLRIVPGRLFDNHVAIDLALTIFDFDAPGFWELVHSVRCAGIDAAAAHGVALAVTTFCYVAPDDRPLYDDFETIMQRHDGELLPLLPGRGRAQSRQSRPRRTAQADVAGRPDEGFRPLRFRAGAASRLSEARY